MRIALTILTLLFAHNLFADEQTIRMKAGTCLGCHGVPSYTNVYPSYSVPKLAGQHAEYLAAALRAYQSGERQHPTMQAQAIKLSEQDIIDISKFFSLQLSFEAAQKPVRKVVVDEAKLATCTACHTATGNSTIPVNPRLAGQHRNYLLHSLKSYKNGQRTNPIMVGLVTALTEEDMESMAAYYASQVGLNTVDVGQAAFK